MNGVMSAVKRHWVLILILVAVWWYAKNKM